MKYLLPVAGVALALSLAGTPAFADSRDRGDRHTITQQNGNDNPRWHKGPTNDVQPPSHNNQPTNWQNNNHNNGRNWQSNNNYNNWQNNNRNVRPNFDRFRGSFQAQQRFRAGSFRAPSNYNYRRWSFGQRLPSSYLSRSFWLTDAIAYGLFAPPPGLIWVRYGPDALLVDQYTGEIVQVRHGVFYG